MSNHPPYNGYEPNEPRMPEPDRYGETPPVRAGMGDAYRASAASTDWEEAGYTPNEPHAAQPDAYGAQPENRYTRPTWDEAPYFSDGAASSRRRRSRTAAYDSPLEPAGAADPAAEDAAAYATPDEWSSENPYRRPLTDEDDAMAMSARFAPPLKFELPGQYDAAPVEGGEYAAPAEPMLYQTRKPAASHGAGTGFDPLAPAPDYLLEAENTADGRRGRRRRGLRGLLITLCVLAVLGGAIYLGRDFLLAQVKNLFGTEAAESVNQAVNQAIGGVQQVAAAFDPAPAAQVGDRASKGIAAVAGALDMETYAVTGHNVVTRSVTGENQYDYYLFAASDGRLLGYYEGLGDGDFLVCADDVYYVAQPPYLINADGLPLIDPSRYRQAAGEHAVIGPLTGGWASIINEAGTASNFIDAKGDLISALWFAKAWPFTAGATLAWVDTGNVTEPEERYALYQLTRAREMKLWKHAANMDEVLGCAAGVAVLADGTVARLDAAHTTLCTTDDATVYADCGALVARDVSTGKYALFVGGDQHYDFAYDRIAPVPSEIRWAEHRSGFYNLLTVTGMAYPLPLSHYFQLEKDGAREMVALSTGSVYPLRLQ